MDRLLIMFSRVVHRRKIAARNKRDLIPVTIVVGSEQPTCIFVFLSIVLKSEPTDRPCHPAARASSLEGLPPGTDMVRAVVRGFIVSYGTGRRDLNLIHTNDRNVSEISPTQ